MNDGMSMNEPGLDLHEWETRWAEIEAALADDPAEALVEACDEIEELLRVRVGEEALQQQLGELERAYGSARQIADRLERGEDVDPGDVGGAIENLRLVRDALALPDDR
jgi:hypothetical protein